MMEPQKLYELPGRTELCTRRCDLRCESCRHCQQREIPQAELERVLAEPPRPEPRTYRIAGGDPFRYGELDRWVAWARKSPRSRVCVEGPAATLAGQSREEAVARLLAVKADFVAAVLPTVDPTQTARFTGVSWDPAVALDTLARLADAGVGVEVVFPANANTAAELPAVVRAASERLGARVIVTIRRTPVVRQGAFSLPLVNAQQDWGELDALSLAIAQLPAELPNGARLHMDEHHGYAPCMLSREARRKELVHVAKSLHHRPAKALGPACEACAWGSQCTWRGDHGKPPSDQVNPLTREEALELQEKSGASVVTHQPRTFKTDRSKLGLPDLLCLSPWTTLSTTNPRHHPVPCALSWVDTILPASELAKETGLPVQEEEAHLREASRRWDGSWYVMDNEEFSLVDLWNSPLLRRMRREMFGGGASSRCRSMCRVVMGVEERGLWYFQRADDELPPELAANRRLLMEEIHAHKNVLTAKPLEVMAGVSGNCNISCGFCDGPLGEFGDLSDRRRDEIISLLPTMMSFGVSGPGEPLMSRNYLALLAHISDRGYPGLAVSLTTNGTLLTPQFLERHRNVPWSHVRISMNAGSAQTHERMTGKKLFDRVRQNLDALCQLRDSRPNRFKITLSCVLGSVQMGDLANFAEIVTQHETDVIVEPMYGDLRQLSPWTRPERLTVLADELKSVADSYMLKNPPLSRAFRAVEAFARDRLAGRDWRPLDHH